MSASSASPRPRRSSAPGRWLLISTSALASRSTKRFLPSGLLMSIRTVFLPPLTLSQIGVTQSPRGESTRMTSAPCSANAKPGGGTGHDVGQVDHPHAFQRAILGGAQRTLLGGALLVDTKHGQLGRRRSLRVGQPFPR